ncbi:hypothetical protein [Paraclostridium tenue]
MLLRATKILKANENNQLFMLGIQNLNSLNQIYTKMDYRGIKKWR